MFCIDKCKNELNFDIKSLRRILIRTPGKKCILTSKIPIYWPNSMFDHLLESSLWDDSHKWSNIGFGAINDINIVNISWNNTSYLKIWLILLKLHFLSEVLINFVLHSIFNLPVKLSIKFNTMWQIVCTNSHGAAPF